MGCSASVKDSRTVIQSLPLPRNIQGRRQWPTPNRVTSKLTPRSWTNINLSLVTGGGGSVSVGVFYSLLLC